MRATVLNDPSVWGR